MSKRRLPPVTIAPPADLDLERQVLGCVMLYGDRPEYSDQVRQAVVALDPLDFHGGAHRAILAALRGLVGRKGPVDVVAVHGRLVASGTLSPPARPSVDQVQASSSDVGECLIVAGWPQHLDYYRRTLRDHAGRRAAILLATDLLSKATREPTAGWCQQASDRIRQLARFVEATGPRPTPRPAPQA